MKNSIDRDQPERNYEDLRGRAAVRKIREIVEKSKNCFFCTAVTSSGSDGARPMNVRKIDASGVLWFLSAEDSRPKRRVTGSD